jgi:hypothetical protein
MLIVNHSSLFFIQRILFFYISNIIKAWEELLFFMRALIHVAFVFEYILFNELPDI